MLQLRDYQILSEREIHKRTAYIVVNCRELSERFSKQVGLKAISSLIRYAGKLGEAERDKKLT